MADQVLNVHVALRSDDVIVRAVQFFTNERWRAQSQSERIATFVGRPKFSYVQLVLAILLTLACVLPGVIYYLLVIRKAFALQNIVVTTTPHSTYC